MIQKKTSVQQIESLFRSKWFWIILGPVLSLIVGFSGVGDSAIGSAFGEPSGIIVPLFVFIFISIGPFLGASSLVVTLLGLDSNVAIAPISSFILFILFAIFIYYLGNLKRKFLFIVGSVFILLIIISLIRISEVI